MKIEIPHHPDSLDYINLTFYPYKEVYDKPDFIQGRCIIHMYPFEDTKTDGELLGFEDAYNCHLHIYDLDKGTVYKSKASTDQIEIRVPSKIRIFKDLSTMIIIDKPVRFGYHQSFDVWEYSKEM